MFAATAPLFVRAGLPPVWGMVLATVTVIVPLELTLVRRDAGRRTGRPGLAAAVDLRRPARRELLTVLVPTLVFVRVRDPACVRGAAPRGLLVAIIMHVTVNAIAYGGLAADVMHR